MSILKLYVFYGGAKWS